LRWPIAPVCGWQWVHCLCYGDAVLIVLVSTRHRRQRSKGVWDRGWGLEAPLEVAAARAQSLEVALAWVQVRAPLEEVVSWVVVYMF
jgi:hypothetical protein